MTYQSYGDLDIYKRAHKLAIEIHEMSLNLLKFEIYEEGSQIRRSSKSIKSNIVEGFGRRRYKQEFIKSVDSGHKTRNENRESSIEDQEKYND